MNDNNAKIVIQTYNWSPLKSPNATIRPPSFNPMEPACMREFFVNRLGGKGHIDDTGDINRRVLKRAGNDGLLIPFRHGALWEIKEPPSIIRREVGQPLR